MITNTQEIDMHFFPFILGMAAGSVITYVVNDDTGKQLLKDTGGKITDGVSSLTGKAKGMFKKAEEEVAEAADAVTT